MLNPVSYLMTLGGEGGRRGLGVDFGTEYLAGGAVVLVPTGIISSG